MLGEPDDVKGPCAFMHGLCAHRVAENLFLGSREAAERPSAELAALGISAVVNCTRDGAADGVPCVHEAAVSVPTKKCAGFPRAIER